MPTPTPRPDRPRKIVSIEEARRLREQAREQGRSVVQCHGCFDIVHPGHIRHLRQAKSLGEILLVTVTPDEDVGKGTGRPLIPQELRAENLAALDVVDWVVVGNGPTAEGLLAGLRPDVYVKGREYEHNNDPRFAAERLAVESHGGRVVFTSGEVVFSSSALIAAIDRGVDPYHLRLMHLTQTAELSGEKLFGRIGSFRGKRVVVVGESIVDTYVLCERPEVAGEAPVMTLRPVERRRFDGGAAVIALHAAALGARPVLVTAMDDGEAAGQMTRRLEAAGVRVRALPVATPIAEKQRYLVGSQKVMKLDLVEPMVLDESRHGELEGLAVDAAREGCDAAIIADFGLGLFGETSLASMCKSLAKLAGFTAGDVSGRRSHLLAMRGIDLVCPSEQEARDCLGMHGQGLPMVVWKLLKTTGTKSAMVTMGADGLVAFDPLPGVKGEGWRTRLKSEHVPALAPLALDALGCGDALLTVATLARASGAGLLEAAFLGSCAAAVQVQRLGNPAVGAADLRRCIARLHSAHLTFAPEETVEARPAMLKAS